MKAYIKDIRYAAELQLSAIWHEYLEIVELEKSIDALVESATHLRKQAEFLAEIDDVYDNCLATGKKWEAYEDEGEAIKKMAIKGNLEQSLKTKKFSIAACSATILQFSKQGISIAHQGLIGCPTGRKIGSQDLKTVIWQGRNQSLHWEEGKPKQPVVTCFNTLVADFGLTFGPFSSDNLAFEVVKLLEWKDFAAFESDLLSLA